MSTHPPTLTKPSAPASGTDHDALPPGTRFGEFEIIRVLGVGGFGIVYLASDHSLEREVALKEYMPASLAARGAGPQITVRSSSFAETYAIGLRSFINEARLLARFDHPSLVKVYRFWEDNATAYMVMPFLQGMTLRDTRRGMAHAPDEAWIRSVLTPILSALELLHREGVYHRDIAPDNILLPPDGPPVLLDFGAARRVISDRTQSLTAILKPSYAPIEQYAEMTQLRQGPWTDLYALGAVIHYLLFGAPPAPATARAVQDDADAIESRIVPGVSPRFLEAMSWMLAIRPNQRPQSGEQLRAVLDGRADVPPRGRPGITLPGAPVAAARRRRSSRQRRHDARQHRLPADPSADRPRRRARSGQQADQLQPDHARCRRRDRRCRRSRACRRPASRRSLRRKERPCRRQRGRRRPPAPRRRAPPRPPRGCRRPSLRRRPRCRQRACRLRPRCRRGRRRRRASRRRRAVAAGRPRGRCRWPALPRLHPARASSPPLSPRPGRPRGRRPCPPPPPTGRRSVRPRPRAPPRWRARRRRRRPLPPRPPRSAGCCSPAVARSWPSPRSPPGSSRRAATGRGGRGLGAAASAAAAASTAVATTPLTPPAPSSPIIVERETPTPAPEATAAAQRDAPASPTVPAPSVAVEPSPRLPASDRSLADGNGAASAIRARPAGKPVPRIDDPALAANGSATTTRPGETPSFGAGTGTASTYSPVRPGTAMPSTQPPRDAFAQRPPSVAEAAPVSVHEACGRRSFIAQAVCMDEKCEEPRYRATAECIPILERKSKRQY